MNSSRRSFLKASAVTASVVAGAVTGLALPRRARAQETVEFGSRQMFDRLDAVVGVDPTLVAGNESGALGWGGGYLLQSYILMYAATRDTIFLDKLIERFDKMLAARDSARGLVDHRGKSLPAWRTGGKYTCGAITLKNRAGQDVLVVRSGARPANQMSVTISAGSRDDTFKLTATKTAPKGAEVDVYDNLTLERESGDYAIRRINGDFAKLNGGAEGSRTMITASDPRPVNPPPSLPAFAGPLKLPSQPYIYAVQTGMVLLPVAEFIRLAYGAPELQSAYMSKADEYLRAVEEAVAIFDYEWQENAGGEGWLNWAKGSPIPFDGCDQAHNQYLALGRVLIELSLVAPGEKGVRYRDRVAKMARTFKNDLKLMPNGAYSWTYFWTKGRAFNGWSEKDDVSVYQPTWVYNRSSGHRAIEDSSHAHIDVMFALSACKHGIVFDEQDMTRFATTLTKNVLVRDGTDVTTMENVDGSGERGMFRHMAGTWAPFARFDPTALEMLRTLYRKPIEKAVSQPALMFACANMNLAGVKRHHG